MKLNKRNRIVLLVFLGFLLVLVRAYEDELFYDPFIDYFKFDYLKGEFPFVKKGVLFINIVARFLMNTIISLAIIYIAYLNMDNLIFAVKFYVLAFAVIALFYFLHLILKFSNGYLFAFYLRRILIHPVLLFILLPTFYFQKKMKTKV